MNNPVNAVDPNGMDIYLLRDDGTIFLALRTEDEYDQLYGTQRDEGDHLSIVGDPLKVNDKGLLSQLHEGKGSAETSNSTDAFNVFKFAADNSNVEWSLSGFKDSNQTKFYLNTQHSESYANVGDGGVRFETKDMIFNVHSHSKKDGVKGGSGYMYNPNGKLAQYAPESDGSNSAYYYRLLGNKMPNLYVYHRYTQGLYQYTPWNHATHKWLNIQSGKRLNNIINR